LGLVPDLIRQIRGVGQLHKLLELLCLFLFRTKVYYMNNFYLIFNLLIYGKNYIYKNGIYIYNNFGSYNIVYSGSRNNHLSHAKKWFDNIFKFQNILKPFLNTFRRYLMNLPISHKILYQYSNYVFLVNNYNLPLNDYYLRVTVNQIHKL